jgi:hypothetical protein
MSVRNWADDRLVSASSLEELRGIKPQIAVIVLEGPHLLIQREPHKAAETVVRFVRSGSRAETVSHGLAGL